MVIVLAYVDKAGIEKNQKVIKYNENYYEDFKIVPKAHAVVWCYNPKNQDYENLIKYIDSNFHKDKLMVGIYHVKNDFKNLLDEIRRIVLEDYNNRLKIRLKNFDLKFELEFKMPNLQNNIELLYLSEPKFEVET